MRIISLATFFNSTPPPPKKKTSCCEQNGRRSNSSTGNSKRRIDFSATIVSQFISNTCDRGLLGSMGGSHFVGCFALDGFVKIQQCKPTLACTTNTSLSAQRRSVLQVRLAGPSSSHRKVLITSPSTNASKLRMSVPPWGGISKGKV